MLLSISKQMNLSSRAKCFAESFYFECAATRASKRVAENLKRAAKETKRTEQMETKLTVNEQSVRNMVQQEISKLSPVSPSVKATSLSHKNSKSHGKDKPSSKNRKQQRCRDSSQDAVTSAAPRPQQKMHKGDEVDQNSRDSSRNLM